MTAPKNASARPAHTLPLTLDERIAISTAKGWVPSESGETTLENVEVVGLRMHTDPEFGSSPVVIYRKDDGEYVAVYAFHTVLRERLAELGTTIGSRHTLRYLGSQTSNKRVDSEGKPQRYESYYVENAGAEVTAVSEDFKF
jgi:hypothetical protein